MDTDTEPAACFTGAATPSEISAEAAARTIGDRPKLKGSTLTLQRGRRSFSFSEGYGVRVSIKDVDFIKLQVLLEVES